MVKFKNQRGSSLLVLAGLLLFGIVVKVAVFQGLRSLEIFSQRSSVETKLGHAHSVELISISDAPDEKQHRTICVCIRKPFSSFKGPLFCWEYCFPQLRTRWLRVIQAPFHNLGGILASSLHRCFNLKIILSNAHHGLDIDRHPRPKVFQNHVVLYGQIRLADSIGSNLDTAWSNPRTSTVYAHISSNESIGANGDQRGDIEEKHPQLPPLKPTLFFLFGIITFGWGWWTVRFSNTDSSPRVVASMNSTILSVIITMNGFGGLTNWSIRFRQNESTKDHKSRSQNI
jgi:hypothetical protein